MTLLVLALIFIVAVWALVIFGLTTLIISALVALTAPTKAAL